MYLFVPAGVVERGLVAATVLREPPEDRDGRRLLAGSRGPVWVATATSAMLQGVSHASWLCDSVE